MTSRYDQFLEIVAENPGKTSDELMDLTADYAFNLTNEGLEALLEEAGKRKDVLEFDNQYWVMRKEEYAFSEYDHPET